ARRVPARGDQPDRRLVGRPPAPEARLRPDLPAPDRRAARGLLRGAEEAGPEDQRGPAGAPHRRPRPHATGRGRRSANYAVGDEVSLRILRRLREGRGAGAGAEALLVAVCSPRGSEANSFEHSDGKLTKVLVGRLDGALVSSNRAVGRAEKEHRFLGFLSHRHQGPVVLELGQAELVGRDVDARHWRLTKGLSIDAWHSVNPSLEGL